MVRDVEELKDDLNTIEKQTKEKKKTKALGSNHFHDFCLIFT